MAKPSQPQSQDTTNSLDPPEAPAATSPPFLKSESSHSPVLSPDSYQCVAMRWRAELRLASGLVSAARQSNSAGDGGNYDLIPLEDGPDEEQPYSETLPGMLEYYNGACDSIRILYNLA